METLEFIELGSKIHNGKYDYSCTNLNDKDEKGRVKIICPIHGEFWQLPYNHLKGCGCDKCGRIVSNKKRELGIVEINHRIQEICSKYDVSFIYFCDKNGEKLEFQGLKKTYVKYVCLKCKKTYVRPLMTFIKTNEGKCRKCGLEKSRQKQLLNINDVYKKISVVCENNKYLFLGFYDKNKFECQWYGVDTYLKMKCNKCDYEWFITYDNLIRGKRCPQCRNIKFMTERMLDEKVAKERIMEVCEKNNLTFVDFCDKNGDIIKFKGNGTNLILRCNKCGFIWKTSTYTNFVRNQNNCAVCSKTSKLENDIIQMFQENGITDFLHRKRTILDGLELDFYIPSKNVAIECQGLQHFQPIEYFGGIEEYEKRQNNDKIKRKLCEERGIKLLYYSNLGIDYPYHVFEDKEELLKEIL